MPNRLIKETSPYLLQHAYQPVDWYPWGEEALARARTEDRPIFLSIGYSACHWCHVMAHESFEDERVAAILNQHFVSIKVDREERPDLDHIYMTAVQVLTGAGGWPLSVFLTPTGQPFYGGTYFPPVRRYGRPSFTEVLEAIARGWRDRRPELVESGMRLAQIIQHQDTAGSGQEHEGVETLDAAFQHLWQQFDPQHGGWGGAPKFPQPLTLEFLLRYHHTRGDQRALQMVTHTLTAMARGGIYDQLGGGFHRYAVDAHWTVPHFEKMLYDQALLAPVYLHAWQVTGGELFRTIAEETLDYVVREMTNPAGGFYSSQDADSEGQEGRFYVWTPAEILQVVGPEASAFMAAYGVTARGNFEGQNILTFSGEMEQRAVLAEARHKLFAARQKRVHPGRDAKVLTSWNGLMLAALAEAARVLDRHDYLQVARSNADFLWRELRQENGRLWHTWQDGRAKQNGFLEDYAHLIYGLLELYQATFEPCWYAAAAELAATMIAHFSDPGGGFFDTSDDHEPLITRPRNLQDGAVPSGNAMAATVLLRLAGLAVEPRYAGLARESLRRVEPLLAQAPLGVGQWLLALDYALSRPREIAIVGDPAANDTRDLLAVALAGYQPHRVVAVGATAAVPLLADRAPLNGATTAYVCLDATCLPPVTRPSALQALL